MKSIEVEQEPVVHTGDPTATSAGVTVATTRDANPAAVAVSGENSTISPAGLIQFAIESKTPAAELKELVALHERMEDRNARKIFFEALRAFQKDCPPIKRNKTANIPTKSGGSYSFKYAELDEIERQVKPYLEKHEFAYNFDTAVDEKGLLLTNTCTLRHIAGHSERSSFTLPTSSESAMTAQQRFSAANNFAKRQTLAAVLGISISDKEAPEMDLDPVVITDDQVTHIEDLLTETGADRIRFLRYAGVNAVSEIRAADYKAIVAVLEQKKGKKA